MPASPASVASRVVGERFRERRLELGSSQEEVAHLAGLNMSNYGKIERGLSNPTMHTLVRIAAVLDIDPGTVIAGLTADDLPPGDEAYTVQDFIRERQSRASR